MVTRKIIGIPMNQHKKSYPSALPLPPQVQEARAKRHRALTKVATIGIVIRIAIVALELGGYAFFHSWTLLLDALGSLIDVAASSLLIVCIRLAERPPDTEHPFGHGRYEPLAGMQMGFFLVLLGTVLVFQQIIQLIIGEEMRIIDARTWIFSFIATVCLEVSYFILKKTARKQDSPALESDAFHYHIDALNSLLATIVLLIAAFNPLWSVTIDHCGAIIIATILIALGAHAAKNNLHQILDRIPDPKFFDRVSQAALRVPGVQETEKIGIRKYGPDAHVNIDVEVSPEMSVEHAHEISQKVRLEIQKEWPSVRDVSVHIEPFYPDDH